MSEILYPTKFVIEPFKMKNTCKILLFPSFTCTESVFYQFLIYKTPVKQLLFYVLQVFKRISQFNYNDIRE